MRLCRQFAFVLLLAGGSALAADIALLRNGFEIRHERREQAGDNTRLYFSAASDSGYVDVPTADIEDFRHDDTPAVAASSANPQAPPAFDFRPLVNAASDRHLVDADLITSVIHAESNFNPRARSAKGAQGLMQLMPGTASTLGVNDAFEPAANIDGGTRYLRELLLRYNGDMTKALAAYNAGPYRVTQYRGLPPYRETHAYVARVIREFNRKKLEQQKFGLAEAQPDNSTRTKAIKRTSAPKPPAAGKSTTPSPARGAGRITVSSGN